MEIKRLTLPSAQLDKQKHFYKQILGMPVRSESTDQFEIQVGSSVLRFTRSNKPYYYHFAFNIPPHQVQEAFKWAKKRVEILPFKGNEIVDFTSWNAEAFYFYDEDQNIVEFIARKNLKTQSQMTFSGESLLEISEIGLPTKDVKHVYDQLSKDYGLSQYDGDRSRFCAVGGERGLFIVVDYRHKKWIPNDDEARPFPMQVVIKNKARRVFNLKYRDEILRAVEEI